MATLTAGRAPCRIGSGETSQVDFARLLGAAAFNRLTPAVRARFGLHAVGCVTVYQGRMEVRASLAGYVLAQLCRLIGTPLAPGTGSDVPVTVKVYADTAGLVWDRIYAFKDRAPVLVRSRKIQDGDGGLVEVVRCGLGMALDVCEVDGGLVFSSRAYFIDIFGLKLTIPHLLTPGRVRVAHQDMGGGRFRFTLQFDHPWLGRTFHQQGVFEDPAES